MYNSTSLICGVSVVKLNCTVYMCLRRVPDCVAAGKGGVCSEGTSTEPDQGTQDRRGVWTRPPAPLESHHSHAQSTGESAPAISAIKQLSVVHEGRVHCKQWSFYDLSMILYICVSTGTVTSVPYVVLRYSRILYTICISHHYARSMMKCIQLVIHTCMYVYVLYVPYILSNVCVCTGEGVWGAW